MYIVSCGWTYLKIGVWFPQDGEGIQIVLSPGKNICYGRKKQTWIICNKYVI